MGEKVMMMELNRLGAEETDGNSVPTQALQVPACKSLMFCKCMDSIFSVTNVRSCPILNQIT